jgi:hypothetical protein
MNRYAPLYIGTAGQSDELTPELAGSKAALIWQMTRLGLNVPPAFVLPTELCAPVNRNDPQALAALDQGLIQLVLDLLQLSLTGLLINSGLASAKGCVNCFLCVTLSDSQA